MCATKTYAMYTDGEKVGRQTATTPSRALRDYGDKLADSKGRYGHLADGRRVMALLADASRAYYGRGVWNDATGRRERA